MVSKTVDLGNGLKFNTIGDAKKHFADILDSKVLEQRFSGQNYNEVAALYEAYCKKTNWPIPSPVAGFFPKYERGKGFTTKCFGIEFLDGSIDRFSLDKALSAVAS